MDADSSSQMQSNITRRSTKYLVPFDVLVAIVRFIGIKDAVRYAVEARILLRAFHFNPTVAEIIDNKQRYVGDMKVSYDKIKHEWVVNSSKPLPLIKPPSNILGFENISIEFSAKKKVKELAPFIQNAVAQANGHRLDVEIHWLGEDKNLKIASDIISAVEVFPSGATFPIISINLGSIKNSFPNYRRFLAASLVQEANWLTVHTNNLSPKLFGDYKNWLYYAPSQKAKSEGETGVLNGINLRVLHLRDNGALLAAGTPFWSLIDLISRDIRNASDGQKHEFALLYENVHLLKEADFKDVWDRQPFSLENEHTGEVLVFNRIKIGGKFLLSFHRHQKIGPLQSIERLFNAAVNKVDGKKCVKFTSKPKCVKFNSGPNNVYRQSFDWDRNCSRYSFGSDDEDDRDYWSNEHEDYNWDQYDYRDRCYHRDNYYFNDY